MLNLPKPIFIAATPVDMRLGHDGLAAQAREQLEREVLEGALFVFFNRRVDRVKALWWDRNGYCLLYKRLERGRFRVPLPDKVWSNSVEIDARELLLILEGVRLPQKKRSPSHKSM